MPRPQPEQGKDRKCGTQSQGCAETCQHPARASSPALQAVLTESWLSAALAASCSHSLHRPAEVVVSDGALPAWGGVQSAPRPVGMELQQWTQGQDHQGTQGQILPLPLSLPLHLGWKRGCRIPGDVKVRSANHVGTSSNSPPHPPGLS